MAIGGKSSAAAERAAAAQPAGAPQAQPAPQAPYGERLPSAPRERKPALALLAVLLVLAGALGTTVLVMRSGERISAIKVTQRIAAGQHIPAGAITEVLVAKDSGLTVVPWTQRSLLTDRYYAVSEIVPGTLLTGQMLSDSPGIKADQVVVGLSLKSGQYPPGLREGDRVRVLWVGRDAGKATAAPGSSGTASTVLAAEAVVQGIADDSSGSISSGLNLSVYVPADRAAAVASAASSGEAAVVLLPARAGS
ncbi:hypothetical protein [Kitasatospora sp. KL5]|uniref:hypothetical protein n=1 Tax=Kitasatospora sp. KL5 TaxID=3425125 RepID=UPI003D6E52A2